MGKTQHQMANISWSFLVTNLRADVESVHWLQCTYCACPDIIVIFETHGTGHVEFAWTLCCCY